MREYRRHAVVVTLILAAINTPHRYDFSTTGVATSLALYEVSITICFRTVNKRRELML
jgi:Sec-independent protein secretion pathway component TatC